MSKTYRVTERNITDYRKDPRNANRGTPRGKAMIADSFAEVGPVRPLAADADGVLIAGNQSIDGAIAAGIKRVVEIETTGDVLVIHRRADMHTDEPRRQRAALLDNRTNQVDLDFDPDVLLADRELLDGLFRDDEIEALLTAAEVEAAVSTAVEEGMTSRDRITANRAKQIKPVLYADEVAVFERALAATGLTNRGEALMEICRVYLEANADGEPT